ncbi:TPA: ATP-binding cassette domain-containing protein [Streptococcus pyogenes]
MPCIIVGKWILNSTSVSSAVATLQKLKLSKDSLIMISVIFRCLPTIKDEWGHINMAMKTRGINFNLINLTRKPTLIMEYFFVPLFVSVIEIGDELSQSAIIRGLDAPVNKTSRHLIKFRKNDIGFVFQDYMLLDSLTIRENISVALSLKNIDSSKIDDLINSYAKRFNLYEQLKKYPYQLSGGQRQRVSIIRAIIKEPEIIFADEPTGALDLKSSEETMMILSEINKTEKVTILMVTHDVLSASYADRVVLLKDGKLHLEIDKEDCGETFYDVISQALSDRGE